MTTARNMSYTILTTPLLPSTSSIMPSVTIVVPNGFADSVFNMGFSSPRDLPLRFRFASGQQHAEPDEPERVDDEAV